MYCGSGLVLSGTEGIGSYFHVLRAQTRFRRYRGRRVPFSYFARSDSLSAVSSASGPYFMFGAPVLVFSCTVGVGSRFHVLLSGLVFGGTESVRSRFHVLRPDSFSAVMMASSPVFMFCAPGLIFGRTEGVGSLLHVLRSQNRHNLEYFI
jgi:hypothetical protein